MADEFDTIFDALHAVRQVRHFYASGPEGVERLRDITHMLRRTGENIRSSSSGSPAGAALAIEIAEAIERAYNLKKQT